jgi:predicted nucleotidyltransferase
MDTQDKNNSSQPAQNLPINVPKSKVASFCKRHHIRKLSLFGSVLTDKFRAESDIDVLVEFETGFTPGFAIVSMENELADILGRKVDLRTPGDLSKYFRDQVVREARVEYEIT